MNFCKKISIYLIVFILCAICSGCNHADQKAFFKRDSVYEKYTHSSAETDTSKPRRVGNVIYLGSSSTSSSKVPGEPSFEFEDLKR